MIYNNALDMEVVLHATISGGVVIGTTCELFTDPWMSLLMGFVAGLIAVVGF
jgi:ammonia channel protein AmtB